MQSFFYYNYLVKAGMWSIYIPVAVNGLKLRTWKARIRVRFLFFLKFVFQLGTWHNPEFRVPTRNSELFVKFPLWNPNQSSESEPGNVPHCFPTRKNRDFPGNFWVRTRNSEFRWKLEIGIVIYIHYIFYALTYLIVCTVVGVYINTVNKDD